MTDTETLAYDDIIVSNAVKIPFVPAIITPAIEKPMRNNRYEGGECAALRAMLRPGDRVLELGAGLGLLSTVAATTDGVEAVCTVEAHPGLLPLIRETHRLNEADPVTLVHGLIAPVDGPPKPFYLRQNFWASSMEPDSRPYAQTVPVPQVGIGGLIAAHRPTVIVADVEGAEDGLFDQADLSGVRALVIEFHPKVYGQPKVAEITALLQRQGLILQPVDKPTSVRQFLRPEAVDTSVWPPTDPRILVATCMKDEGPFILEWLAWHQSIGVTDFVVFSNHCSDGTDLILERLAALGHVRHIPNPALATGSTHYQPVALAYVPHLPEWQAADFFLSMDVDEFVNIRRGCGHFRDLLASVPSFDALSMSELNHGSNGRIEYEPGLVTAQFPRHQSENPGPRKALRGVKTLVRRSERLEKPRNHRPDFHSDRGPVTWLDGSGRPISTLPEDPSLNGIDVRGTYDLVSLDHFALRSLDSYLLKMLRGDVVVKTHRVSRRYWRTRNLHEARSSQFARQDAAFMAALQELKTDRDLARLTKRAEDIHRARAQNLRAIPEYRERRDWILEHAWDPLAEPAL